MAALLPTPQPEAEDGVRASAARARRAKSAGRGVEPGLEASDPGIELSRLGGQRLGISSGAAVSRGSVARQCARCGAALTRPAAAGRIRRGRWARGRATSWRTGRAGRVCVGGRWCARQTGGGQPVEVRRKEGVTDHLHPESCAGRCEAAGEALTGARTDGAIEHRKQEFWSAETVTAVEGHTDITATGEGMKGSCARLTGEG